MADLRPKVFREPELLEAVCELLTSKGGKTAIQASEQEPPREAQAAACSILTNALRVCIYPPKHWLRGCCTLC